MVLITTALQETFPKEINEKVLFLGEWCKVYNKKSVWEKFDSQTMTYHWNDREKLYTDYQSIQIIYEKILLELSSKLNQTHQVNYSLRYWRILIGPWLGFFIQTLFDRWFMLNTVFDNNQKYHCCVIKREPLSFVPNDMSHFQQWFITDDWNEAIYGQLIELCWINKINVTWIEKIKQVPQSFVAKKIPIIPRAEMLSELMRFKKGIAVAGTHGKTTTTSLIASILSKGNLDPTYVIGGRLNSMNTNAKLGSGDLIVVEADESDASFLHLNPVNAIITNIDNDHLGTYQNKFENLKQAYINFAHQVPFYGTIFICGDDRHAKDIISSISRPVVTYGLKKNVDIQAVNIRNEENKVHFKAVSYTHLTLPTIYSV